LANIELINEVAAPCMKLLTMGFLVFMTIARLTLLVTVSCAKLPVLEITAPLAPEAEEGDPVPHNCAGVTSGPEITVFAGMTLPPGHVTDTPVLHGPTAVAVGVGCASPGLAAVTMSMRVTSKANVKDLLHLFRLGSNCDEPSGEANEYAIVNGFP
jgi:hypothetical protein